MPKKPVRSPEIDLLRCIAIVLMMAFHTAYDLGVLYHWSVDVFHGGWWLIGKVSAILFVLLVGVSFPLSWKRTPRKLRYVGRGAKILAFAVAISAVTYAVDPVTYVRFGILHLIGLSMIILPFMRRLGWFAVIPGFIITGIGHLMRTVVTETSVLLPLGIMPAGFRSIDYYPIFPWFGVILMGMSAGWIFVEAGSPSWFRRIPRGWGAVTAVSKASLWMYVLHQPVILGILHLVLGPVA